MTNHKASNALLVERVNKLEQQRAELLEALKDLVYQVDRHSAPAWLSLDEAFSAITKAEAAE